MTEALVVFLGVVLLGLLVLYVFGVFQPKVDTSKWVHKHLEELRYDPEFEKLPIDVQRAIIMRLMKKENERNLWI